MRDAFRAEVVAPPDLLPRAAVSAAFPEVRFLPVVLRAGFAPGRALVDVRAVAAFRAVVFLAGAFLAAGFLVAAAFRAVDLLPRVVSCDTDLLVPADPARLLTDLGTPACPAPVLAPVALVPVPVMIRELFRGADSLTDGFVRETGDVLVRAAVFPATSAGV